MNIMNFILIIGLFAFLDTDAVYSNVVMFSGINI